MTRQLGALAGVALVLVLAVSGGAAASDVGSRAVDGSRATVASGGAWPVTPAAGPSVVDATPAGATSGWSPSPPRPLLEQDRGGNAPVSLPGSATLASLEPDLRANAVISLEPVTALRPESRRQADRVAALWNGGSFAEAVVALEALESSGASVGVVISWRHPIAGIQQKVYQDVRIGGSRTGGVDAALDYDAATGNIFALIVWQTGMTVNLSTDGGASWSETAALFVGSSSVRADMAVSGSFVWVGYTFSADSHVTPRIRRFDVATGAVDTTYNGTGYLQITTETPNEVTEVVVVGNEPDNGDRIYMAYLVAATHEVKFWWDTTMGTSFEEMSPAISDAGEGLDMTWNPWAANGQYRRWISYRALDGTIKVWRSDGSLWNQEVSHTFTGGDGRTAISAFQDHIYCAFECQSEPGKQGACYLTSDDSGVGTWLHDDAYWPTGDEVSGWAPDLSVRSGAVRAVVFSSETGSIDDVSYVTRSGWTAGAWSDRTWYNNRDHLAGADTYIAWIGSFCVGSYGMLYFDDDTTGAGDHAPYFDLMTARAFFCSGFESGDLTGWAGH